MPSLMQDVSDLPKNGDTAGGFFDWGQKDICDHNKTSETTLATLLQGYAYITYTKESVIQRAVCQLPLRNLGAGREGLGEFPPR